MKTSIIPDKQIFVNSDCGSGLNLKAICIFAATGFFLEKDTFYKDLEALQPATDYVIDENKKIKNSVHYWKWHYSPEDITLKKATEEFAHLFEKICSTKLKNMEVILPLSGGLDSRTQAAVLSDNSNVRSYSYKFEDSFDETKYGKMISEVRSFPFKEYIIPRGYLWNVIDKLAAINKCYADFTSPRQMAVIEEISESGNVFFLGHWGDVLFDDMGVKDEISFEEQIIVILKKILKRSGEELAQSLWASWGLEGNFRSYLEERISLLLQEIKIDNANSRIRAFKSMYWAPRWTSANMEIFSAYNPLVLPYYDDEMCKFICRIPEKLLAGRKVQINYIKMKNAELAKIPWQDYDPYNLYDYKNFHNKARLPGRAIRKGKRLINEKIFGKKLNIRNWEIQFTGEDNDKHLKEHLFDNNSFSGLVSPDTVKYFYNGFKKDPVYYSHSVNMLLTLSMFSQMKKIKTDS
ncbi:MAG TPA: asparagine synthase-related protein [Ignavibacteria bacterium]|nr:asparagine synthase-related protein [Ignavibacteria bacterium]